MDSGTRILVTPRVAQRNYRGRLYGMLILNAGFVFRSIWQLVSVVLPERTKSKIKLTPSCTDVRSSSALVGSAQSFGAVAHAPQSQMLDIIKFKSLFVYR